MIEAIISSKTRVKLLLKFFLNSNTTAYLRSLEGEFGDSSNAIRVELNRLEKAGMLVSKMSGNKKIFQANTKHPLFSEINKIIMKHVGLDSIIENVIERLGDVEKVFVIGDFAKGIDRNIIDLLFIGNIDKKYLVNLVGKAEELINRKIRYLVYTIEEFEVAGPDLMEADTLLLWSKESSL